MAIAGLDTADAHQQTSNILTSSATVLDSFPRVLGATHEDAIAACGRHQRQLVKCEDLSTGLHRSSYPKPLISKEDKDLA